MLHIKLKNFQQETINAILEQFENPNGTRTMIVKAPTGSGKTITLIGLIEQFIGSYFGQYIFCWLTPGKGDLEEQSKDKMDKFAPNLASGNLFDVLTSGFSADTTYFINWESITKKGNIAIKEGERKNLFDKIADAHKAGLKFIVIIDEEHENNTNKAKDIISAMSPIREIRVSATPELIKSIDTYIISEKTVIGEQLITKALYINHGLNSVKMNFQSEEFNILIDKADEMRQVIEKAYRNAGEDINPLVLIQFPSLSDSLIESVEKKLAELGYTYDNELVASWFSPENKADEAINSTKIGKHNIGEIGSSDSITNLNAKPRFLLFKQALSTGWDCPRAKILVKLRDNMTERFEIQTLGRLRRMPKAIHYGSDILDCAYLYTFDEAYKEDVIKNGNGFEVKRLKLKDDAKKIKLYKEVVNRDINLIDERKARKSLYEYFLDTYKLEPIINDKEAVNRNKVRLEAHGYIFGSKLKRSFLVGKYNTLQEVLSSHDTRELDFEVNTHSHGMLLLHEVGKFCNILGLSNDKMRTILCTFFLEKYKSLAYKIIPLPKREYYAFIINNQKILKELFISFEETNGNKKYTGQGQIFPDIKIVKSSILSEEVYPYIPEPSAINFAKNVYEGYESSMVEFPQFRSTSEILFEKFCESSEHVRFVYKNGDKGIQYLSIVYQTGIGKIKNFYPDYVVQMQDDSIWIIETKGGEAANGKSKNIDIECIYKLNALKRYADEHGFKFGFVRDKNTSLFINRTGEWVSDMSDTTKWERLETVLKEV